MLYDAGGQTIRIVKTLTTGPTESTEEICRDCAVSSVGSAVPRGEISLSDEEIPARSTWGAGRSPAATASRPGGADNGPWFRLGRGVVNALPPVVGNP